MELHVDPSLSLKSAALYMSTHRLSALGLLCPSGQLQCILSEQDLVRRPSRFSPDVNAWSFATANPVCVEDGDDLVERCLALMADRSFRHMPIMRNGKCTGILDIAHAVGSGKAQRLAHTLCWPAGKLIRMHSRIGGAVLALEPDQSVDECMKLFQLHAKTAMLVFSDHKELIGIVTESDIVRKVLAKAIDPVTVVVRDIMTSKPFTVKPSINPFDGLHEMIKRGFRHLPVESIDGGIILDILTLVKVSYRTQHESSLWTSAGQESDDDIPDLIEPVPEKDLEKRAVAAIVDNKFEEAVRLLGEAIKNASDEVKPRLLLRRGHVVSCLGDLQNAMNDFEECMRLSPTTYYGEALNGSCEILIETGRYEESAARMTREMPMKDRHPCLKELKAEMLKHKDLGSDLFTNKDFCGAIAAYTSAIRAHEAMLRASELLDDPMTAILYGNRSACYQSVKDFKYAFEDAEKSIKCDPTYWKSWVRKCNSLFEMKKYSDCGDAIEQAKKCVDVSNTGAYSRLDEISLKLKENENPLSSIKSLGQTLAAQFLNNENQSTN